MADEPTYSRNEDDADRYDRQWIELLQELRLAQAGTQILFAFLLAISFTLPFRESDTFTHIVFASTLVLAALSTALKLAPVSLHRVVFAQRLRHRMLPVASWMASGGLALLVLTMCGAVVLALDAVLSRGLTIFIAIAVAVWFAVFWYVIPAIVRTRR